jgi:TolB protein
MAAGPVDGHADEAIMKMVRTFPVVCIGVAGAAVPRALGEQGPAGVFALELRRPVETTATQETDGPAKPIYRSEIWTVQADGSDAKCLMQKGTRAGHPRWSPDGNWLYFQSNTGGTWQIYRCRPDGSGCRQLTKKPKLNCYGYDISPDGRLVAYACHPDSSPAGVALMLASGRDPRFLVRNWGYNYMPMFSPDGTSVVFASTRDGNYEVYRINIDGTAEKNLTRNKAKDFLPQWDPLGRYITFFRATTETVDTFRVDPDGGNVIQVTHGARHDTMRLSANDRHGATDPPAISPDGQRIAYIARTGPYGKVHVVGADGSNARQVAAGDGPCFRVKWSPDGKHLAFVTWVGDRLSLFTVDANGLAPPQPVADLPGDVIQYAWGPADR